MQYLASGCSSEFSQIRKEKRFLIDCKLFTASVKLLTQSPALYLYDMEINSSSSSSTAGLESTLRATKWLGVLSPSSEFLHRSWVVK